MIIIKDKQDCCGCSACVQKCPKNCISLKEDSEGFLYPHVDYSKCIDCHLCEKVCPFLNRNESTRPIQVFAAKNPKESVRLQSSSGGIFSMLAESVIKDGGVVFGAAFNKNWIVYHTFTENIEGLSAFRGSKYVQSIIGSSFIDTENFLKSGRKVLFSGTPCQIAALNTYLRSSYDNLLTVDVVCHGVPSPLIFQEYFNSLLIKEFGEKLDSNSKIKEVSFRDKRFGWEKYGFSFLLSNEKKDYQFFQRKKENKYLVGFLSDVFLRPSCYSCPIKNGKSGSDITIADYWGIKNEHFEFYDEKGVSCVIINTEKGYDFYNTIPASNKLSSLSQFKKQNPAYYKSHKIPDNRKKFWNAFYKNGVLYAIDRYAKPSIKESLRSSIIILISKFGLVSFVKKIIKK